MTQTQMTTLAGAGIIALGGLILIGWLTGRIQAKRLRRGLRIIGYPLFVALVAVATLVLARSQTQLLPETTPLVVASESQRVELGTLIESLNSTGSLTSADEKTLTFGTSAPVTEVLVSAGDTVKAGDVLAKVDTTSIDAQIRDAELSLKSAQQSLDALKAPASDLDVKSAELSVQAAQASLSSASQTGSTAQDVEIANIQVELAKNSLYQSQLNRDISDANARPNQTNAYASEVQTNASLAQAESNVTAQELSADSVASDGADAGQLASANAQLISAQSSLDELLAGATDSELRQAEISVETAQLALDAAEKLRSDAEIVAPFDGVVASVDLAVGEMPSSGSITLINTGSYTMTLSVDEKDITQLAVGQAVNVTVEALGDTTLTGSVTHVDPIPASTDNLVTYNVEVTLDSTNAALRPGMTAVATVILNQVGNVIVIPNRFITTDATSGATSVKVQTASGIYSDVPVTLGAATDSESIVSSGLSVGQNIVILSSGSSSSTSSSGLGLLGGLGGGAAGGPPAGGGGAPPSGGGGFPGGGG